MTQQPVRNVTFDVGRVLFCWDMRILFERLVDDPAELEFVLTHVVTEEWHYQHDAGRALDDMVAERKILFPQHGAVIDAYATRFLETIPGPVPGSIPIVEELDAAGMPLFAITNFADLFWKQFRPTQPVFDRFRDIVVSGTENWPSPEKRSLNWPPVDSAWTLPRRSSSTIMLPISPRPGGWAGRCITSPLPPRFGPTCRNGDWSRPDLPCRSAPR